VIQGWRRGTPSEDEQFAEFFVSTFERVTRSVLVIVGDREAADEITQEAFVKALMHWQRIRNYDEPIGWVRKTAIRMALRDRQRASRFETLSAGHEQADGAPPSVNGLDDHIVQALRTLSPMQRAAVALHYLDDLSVATIAETLGCAEATVRVHLHRGRQSLLAALNEEHSDVC
jgi:RNA polymerase sigma-70 factor (ECF subfamily)